MKIAYAERSRVSVGAGRQQEASVGREKKFGGAAVTADRFAGGWMLGARYKDEEEGSPFSKLSITAAGFQHHTGS